MSDIKKRFTTVAIEGEKFTINGEYTYKENVWGKMSIEGLLLNSRMVHGAFDDRNPETIYKWAYNDTGVWDADRNNREFLDMMPVWKNKGLNSIAINLSGGQPGGGPNNQQIWESLAFYPDGSLDQVFLDRIEKIIDRADELGLVIILGYFYWGNAKRLKDDQAVMHAVRNATKWVLDKGFTNVIIEVNNECDVGSDVGYTHELLMPPGVHKLIREVQSMCIGNVKLLVSASFLHVPEDNSFDEYIKAADYILLHGNSAKEPADIEKMIKGVRSKAVYTPKPFLINEDDHFDFDNEDNNFIRAVNNFCGWGYFDFPGYQKVPANWGIDTQRKQQFFTLIQQMTTSKG